MNDRGLIVVGIAVVQSTSREAVQAFAGRFEVNYRILLDEVKVVLPGIAVTVADAYSYDYKVPFAVIVDREGYIYDREGYDREGYIDERRYWGYHTEEDFLEVIEPLL